MSGKISLDERSTGNKWTEQVINGLNKVGQDFVSSRSWSVLVHIGYKSISHPF